MNIRQSVKIGLTFWGLSLFSLLNGALVDTPLAKFTPAQRAWLLDQREEALQLYLQEMPSHPFKEVPLYNVAFLYFFEEKFTEAEQYADRALKINPQYGPALLLKGRLAEKRQSLSDCQTYLKAAITTHFAPYLPEYYLGRFYLSQGKLNEAAKYLDKAIADNDKFTPSYPLLAEVYLKTGKVEQAQKLLEKGLVTSYDAEIVLMLGQIAENRNKLTEASKYYGLFTYLFPEHPQAEQVQQWLSAHKINKVYTHQFRPLPQRATPRNRFFPIGEDYVYNVHWGPIRVGEIRAKIQEKLSFKGQEVYKTVFSLDSNPALEFIATLHSDYISLIDQDTKLVLQHFLHIRENKIVQDKIYDFDREHGRFICRMINEDGNIDYLEKFLPTNTTDGTSLLFYSRQVVAEKRSERVMTIIDENFVITDIFYDGKKEPLTVRGKVEPGILISGENYYKGIVGFTGKFRGWFRDDSTYLPLGSDFEIWVGRIAVTMTTEEEQRQHKYAR